ncbi:Alpha/Beta hydrolase protein, partial [Jimgerdemannia flammicorona]
MKLTFTSIISGQELAFVAKAPGRNYAWETSQYIYLVPTAGDSPPVAINSDIPGASSYPRYKPDGNSIAYLQMFVRQYEADRNRLVTYNRATQRRKVVTADWDCSPSSIAWAVGEDAVFVTAQDKGHVKIFAIDTLTGELLNTLTNIHTASGIQILSPTALIFSMSSLTSPNNIYTISSAASLHTTKSATLTRRTDIHVNHEDPIDFPEPDEFWFVGAQNHPIHGWIITPPNFNSSKKYPLAFLIHGGPQGAWDDAWSVRWNPSVFAGAGFVVVAINPHGSTGYGQNFTDSIKGNWGTLPYDDLDRGLSHVLDKYPFVDEEKVAGLGASYGGFMVNWINGHSD